MKADVEAYILLLAAACWLAGFIFPLTRRGARQSIAKVAGRGFARPGSDPRLARQFVALRLCGGLLLSLLLSVVLVLPMTRGSWYLVISGAEFFLGGLTCLFGQGLVLLVSSSDP